MIREAVTALALIAPAAALAAPTLGPGYGDHMVLQRGVPMELAGTAEPGSTVTATIGNNIATAIADEDGAFRITLAAQEASPVPATLSISDRSGTASYSDVLIGDVFLCSGQSNMELSVNRALDTWNQLRMAADNSVRLLKIPKSTASVPQPAFAEPVVWRAAASDTVADFSAACFYMAKELRRRSPDVPVGLIHSNWGGSAARAWFTPDSVRAVYGDVALSQLRQYANDPFAAAQAFAPQWFDWWRAHDEGREPWTNSAMLDWQPIPKFSFWNEWKGTGLDTNPRANVWLRQTLNLDADQAAQDGALSIGAIDDLDLTFVNGKPVGYTFGWGVERTYRVPSEYLREGENEILIAANNMWDTGGFFGSPNRLFFTPGSGVAVPLGADWEYSVATFDDVPPRAPWDANAGLGVMHNSMIAPLGPMRLAGVAWYQGEADVGQPDYDAKLGELFAGWRKQFGDQTKMLVVQLADFGERQIKPVESGWAQLRQDQLEGVAADRNAALVTAIDIGEPSDIHPANKNVLGRRLAAAFAGRAMPMPVKASRNGQTVLVEFSGIAGSLVSQGGPYPLGVELCGTEMNSCAYALPTLNSSSMEIDVPEGFDARRVRYAWSDAPIVNLYDASGMPVPGFELEIAK